MMKYWKSVVILFCISLFVCLSFSSCASGVRWVNIERLYPAGKMLDAHIAKVAVINNQFEPSTAKDDPTSLLVSGQKVADALAENIADADFFEEVVICDSSVVAPWATLGDDYELTPRQVDYLTRQLGVDMLVSVELAMINVALEKQSDPYTTHATIYSVVKLYTPDSSTPVDTILTKRQVSWAEITKAELEEAIIEESSRAPLAYFMPQWRDVEFPYYVGNHVDMRDADIYVRENDWTNAYTLWHNMLNDKNRKRRMQAHFNLAVWHEIHDDTIDQARTYALKARAIALEKKNGNQLSEAERESSADYRFITRYIRELEKRGEALSRVKIQMNRFSDDF